MRGYWQRLMLNKEKVANAIPELIVPLWMISLYKKVFSLTFQITLKCVGWLIAHRILRLLSFIVPLKVILIAGSDRLPGFIQRPFPTLELNDVVTFLAIFTIFCYISAIKVVDFIDANISKASIVIAKRNKKASNLINIPVQITFNYEQIVKSIAAIMFVLIVVFFGLFINSTIMLLLVLLIASFWGCLFISSKYDWPIKFEFFLSNRFKIQKWWMLISYIIIFVSILLTLSGDMFEDAAIKLIITFLLCRYSIAAANEYISGSFRITGKMDVINSLFFFRVSENISVSGQHNQKELNSEKVRECAARLLRAEIEQFDIKSIRSNISSVYGVHCFDVCINNHNQLDSLEDNIYILKIFEPRYHFLANHEGFLLEQNISKVPAPKILQRETIGDFDCMLLNAQSTSPEGYAECAQAFVSVLCQMWSVPMTNSTVHAYHRTHECDIKRLDFAKLEILKLHSNDEEAVDTLQFLEEHLEDIRGYCLSLPLTLDNPEINIKTVVMPQDSNASLCYQWGRWTVQPIGSTLSQIGTILNDEQINKILLAVKAHREECSALNEDQLMLSAALHTLLRHVEKQRYSEALQAGLNVVSRYERAIAGA